MNRFEQFTDEELTAIMRALSRLEYTGYDMDLTPLWQEARREHDRRKAEKEEE